MVQYARMFFENRIYKSETDKRNERMNILNIEHISKNFGEKLIFDDVSYGIHEGDKIGIVGINGTGKTTFLKMIAGLEEPDNGQIIRQNGLRITYLPQNPEFPRGQMYWIMLRMGSGSRTGTRRVKRKPCSRDLASPNIWRRSRRCPADRKNGSRWQGLW